MLEGKKHDRVGRGLIVDIRDKGGRTTIGEGTQAKKWVTVTI